LSKEVWGYDPSGTVVSMDVFYTSLLPIVMAKNMEDCFGGYIIKWKGFVRGAEWYVIDRGHRTLISPPHVVGFC